MFSYFIFFLLIIIRAESSKSGNSAIHTMFFFSYFPFGLHDSPLLYGMNVWPLWTYFYCYTEVFLICCWSSLKEEVGVMKKSFGLYEWNRQLFLPLISSSSWFCWCYIFISLLLHNRIFRVSRDVLNDHLGDAYKFRIEKSLFLLTSTPSQHGYALQMFV